MSKIFAKLASNHSGRYPEAGCDEAGRGCLAGPVFASAVILPDDYYHSELNDSKVLTEKQRNRLRIEIEKEAISFSIALMQPAEIDQYNILWASVLSMHRALDGLSVLPQHIIVDGNKFIPYENIPYDCIVKGDGKYVSIAAASILAKTYRDEYLERLHTEFPEYNWSRNKGYPTKEHRQAILRYGATPHHRMSFRLLPVEDQLRLF